MAEKVVWAPMPPSKRAKQFAPFQALKGLNEAIANKERLITPRRELTEDSIAEINRVLINLTSGSLVTAVYYCDFAQEYQQLTGYVSIRHLNVEIDPFIVQLHIVMFIHQCIQLVIVAVGVFLQKVIPPVIQIEIVVGPYHMVFCAHGSHLIFPVP